MKKKIYCSFSDAEISNLKKISLAKKKSVSWLIRNAINEVYFKEYNNDN